VARCTPDKEFEFELTRADSEWLGTRVGFELEGDEKVTQVRFHHLGWPAESGTTGYHAIAGRCISGFCGGIWSMGRPCRTSAGSTYKCPDRLSTTHSTIGWQTVGGMKPASCIRSPPSIPPGSVTCDGCSSRSCGSRPWVLRVLDIGCGGGLLAEEFARLGCVVTGVDPSAGVAGSSTEARDESRAGDPVPVRTRRGAPLCRCKLRCGVLL
jgi:hypothetical protein